MFGLAPLLLAINVSIPFTVFDNRILLPVAVDGKPGFRMVLDTGAGGITLTPQVADALRLHTQRAGVVSGAGARSIASSITHLSEVTLGSLRLGPRTAVVLDLEPIRRALHFPQLDGIVGFNALPSRYAEIDSDRHLLTLSDTPIHAPPDAHTVTYAIAGGLLQVDAAVDGIHSQFILDTGDRASLTLFQRFANANGFYDTPPAQRDVITGYGIGGPIRSNVINANLDAFGYTLPNVVTRLPLGNAGVFTNGVQAGSIGNGVLSRFNAVFDRSAHTITLWPAGNSDPPGVANSSAPLPRHGLFGAALADKSGSVVVTRVVPGSAAASAGVMTGDRIVRFNGRPISDTLAFLAALHPFHAGDRVTIQISRNGTTRAITAVLGSPQNESDPDVSTIYGSVQVDGTLRRTLVTVPKTAATRLPAVLIMGGIGCYTIDQAANPQDPYMHLAHDISRAGFAVMRIEKSGVGDSQGSPCFDVDFAAEERGYAAALEALRRDPHVDPARIYLFGHSIGTVEAPQLALAHPVAGIIVAEAVGRDWPEYEVRNLRRQLELQGTAASQVDASLLVKQTCMFRLLFEKEPEPQIERTEPRCKEHNGVYPVAAPYMQQVAAVNIIGLWEKVAVPVLAVYGESDFVTEPADHQRIVAVVNGRRARDATYVPISGMDHLLYEAATPKAAMDAFSKNAPRTYDTALSRIVIAWLRKQAKT